MSFTSYSRISAVSAAQGAESKKGSSAKSVILIYIKWWHSGICNQSHHGRFWRKRLKKDMDVSWSQNDWNERKQRVQHEEKYVVMRQWTNMGARRLFHFKLFWKCDRFIFLAAGYPAFYVRLVSSPILIMVFFAARSRGSAANSAFFLQNATSNQNELRQMVLWLLWRFGSLNCNLWRTYLCYSALVR